MEKIYSKEKPDTLLHIICREEDMQNQPKRGLDISPEKEFLQLRSLKIQDGETIKAHKHLLQDRVSSITQESLVIIKGAIKAYYYDVNNSLLGETVLNAGDCFITFYGGHEFKSLQKDTLVYEYKNGPYNGLVNDKESI